MSVDQGLKLKTKDLGIIGIPKDPNELRAEDIWMKRIEVLEDQYNQHLNQLQKNLLSSKINTRVLNSQRDQNTRLKEKMKVTENFAMGLQTKLEGIQVELNREQKRHRQLQHDFGSNLEKLKEQQRNLQIADDLARKAMREQDLTKGRALIGQKQQAQLANLLKERELQLKQVRAELSSVGNQSQALALSLRKTQDEKRDLEIASAAAEDRLAFQRRERETDEDCMLRLKSELRSVLSQLSTVEKKCNDMTRRREVTEKNLLLMRNEMKQLLSQVSSAALETTFWKEEAARLLKITEATPLKKLATTEKLKRRQGQFSAEAELTRRIQALEHKLMTMETEKISLKNQMKVTLTLHKSLMRLYDRNSQRTKEFETKWRQDFGNDYFRKYCQRRTHAPSNGNQELEKQTEKLTLLEKELLLSKRAYNVLKFKLEQKSELDRNLGKAEVELIRAEREKRQAETTANQTARKLGLNCNKKEKKSDALLNDLWLQVDKVKKMREKLPILIPKKESLPVHNILKNGKAENSGDNLTELRDSIRLLERKQAVYENIKATKERRLAESERLLAAADENLEAEMDNSQEESSDTEDEIENNSSIESTTTNKLVEAEQSTFMNQL